MVKIEVLPSIISKIDNDRGVIFLNGILAAFGRLQTEILKTMKKESVKPNNGLSKK